MIEYRDVHKSFDFPVLSGVDLEVRTGERLALVGSSGTGKSVLLKTTIGLITPDQGDVLIDGESVVQASRKGLARIRQKVGYVFQNAALFDSMNVYENLCQGLPDQEVEGLARGERLDRVIQALRDVNLDPAQVLAKLPSDLSGGMRKRVGLARAIVRRPQILLYDEPVTGLDPVNSAAVARLIASIADRTGATSVVVTHDIEGALGLADRIALLDSGRVRFVGTPGEFRASEDPLVRAFASRDAAAEAARRGVERM